MEMTFQLLRGKFDNVACLGKVGGSEFRPIPSSFQHEFLSSPAARFVVGWFGSAGASSFERIFPRPECLHVAPVLGFRLDAESLLMMLVLGQVHLANKLKGCALILQLVK